MIVIADLAENYSFILQDAAQGFHWNNDQATLHQFVCYYRRDTELEHINLVDIWLSETWHSSRPFVPEKNLVKMLKNKILDIKKLIYFPNGSVSHKNYKNVNLCNHKADFATDAEWHFFATSHGKGPYDGLGDTVKRLAAKASLQWPYNEQIMTPQQLFDFVRENISGINTVYCSMDEWKNEADILKDRFYNSTTIIGIQKLHSSILESWTEVEIKTVSIQHEGGNS